jgi:hypothetical protein
MLHLLHQTLRLLILSLDKIAQSRMFDALRHGADYDVSILRTQGAASVLHLVLEADRLAGPYLL